MIDERLKILAKNLVNYSCELKKNQKVLIEAMDIDNSFISEIVKEVYKVGAIPFVNILSSTVSRSLLMGTSETREKLRCKFDLLVMNNMDAYISIKSKNIYENSDVPKNNIECIKQYYDYFVHTEIRVKKTKWVILNYPTSITAQNAMTSTEKFEDYYFNVCNLNYAKMNKNMDALKKLLEKTDKVRIVSPGTNLNFSIKNMPAVKCAGKNNIPDGEVFTAPIKKSVNGTITYNIPTMSPNGIRHDNIRLVFKDGKIIEASSNSVENINDIFDIDEGARYIGEFAFGLNPYINTPMLDILFDEKMCGSIHFTPGSCYEECDNGNKSALHWDLILSQTKENGGGEIYFDDKLIRKDGKFVIKSLMGLNPDSLT